MRRVRFPALVLAAGLAAGANPEPVLAATGEEEAPQVVEAVAAGEMATFKLRFIQEDGPESGHVRVLLTPEVRPLTVIEARMAAERAFLEALDEPGLGDNLKRITVVVRLMPASSPTPDDPEQVIVYQHKSGSDWSVLAEQ